ncbi:MAG: hypothetical protein IJT75_04600 [Bacteroidaceae bacterium]|nr:hypothetical protein [Bacteroidaceae bacterium]
MGNKKGVKQALLFDMEEPQYNTNPLVLQEPEVVRWKQYDDLLSTLTKADLVELCRQFWPLLDGHTSVSKRTADGVITRAPELEALKKQSMPKADISRALAFMLAAPENMRLYIDTFSEEMCDLWRLVLIRLYVSLDEAKKILQTTNRLSSREGHSFSYYYGGNPSWNRSDMAWFTLVSRHSDKMENWGNYRKEAFYITVSPTIHKIFFPIFFPDAANDHSLTELPEGQYRIVTGEADAQRCYPIVSAMLSGGELALSSGRFLVSGQKVATKRMNLADFGIGETEGLRSALYVQMLTLNHVSKYHGRKNMSTAHYEEIVKEIVSNFGGYSFSTYLPLFIFAHIKGLRKSFTEGNLCSDLAAFDLNQLKAHPDQWVHIGDLFIHSLKGVVTPHDIPFPTLVFSSTRDDYRDDIVNQFTGQPLCVEHFTRHFGNTFHKGILYMLAALGVVELAIRKLNDGEVPISPYHAVAYARLTPLGRYALGLTDEYASSEQEIQYFQVDPERLIVRDLTAAPSNGQRSEVNSQLSTLNSVNPFLDILLGIAHSIGSGRYEVTAQTFLASCSNRDDVKQRINTFKQFICPKPPARWQHFFDELLTRCHPMQLNQTDYRIFNIPPENTTLIRLLRDDSELRRLSILAEGYRILIPTTNYSKFRNRLKALGYLL